ncbi:MAG: hypothetical protein ACTHQQ_24350 [Solirubrobacteraceae bacterium]
MELCGLQFVLVAPVPERKAPSPTSCFSTSANSSEELQDLELGSLIEEMRYERKALGIEETGDSRSLANGWWSTAASKTCRQPRAELGLLD